MARNLPQPLLDFCHDRYSLFSGDKRHPYGHPSQPQDTTWSEINRKSCANKSPAHDKIQRGVPGHHPGQELQPGGVRGARQVPFTHKSRHGTKQVVRALVSPLGRRLLGHTVRGTTLNSLGPLSIQGPIRSKTGSLHLGQGQEALRDSPPILLLHPQLLTPDGRLSEDRKVALERSPPVPLQVDQGPQQLLKEGK